MNRVIRTLTFGVLFAGLAASASADSLPQGASKLDAAGVQKYIVGNTITGFSRGKPYEEYYASDGAIHGSYNGSQYSASWSIRPSDGWMCFKYKNSSNDGCWFAAVVQSAGQIPSVVYWLKSDGSLDDQTPLKQGNPDGL